MIEIWTEDSTVGYRFLKVVNKYIFNNQFIIVPHAGIGRKKPSSKLKFGGILYHIETLKTDDDLVLLFIDKAIDKPETKFIYNRVIDEMAKHNNIRVIEQICFELLILSYSNLFLLTGNNNKNLENIKNDFVNYSNDLSRFSPSNFNHNLTKYIRMHCTKYQYEHVAKVLLTNITNVDTIYNGNNYQLSIIARGKIGSCWVKDCCVIPMPYYHCKKCKFCHVLSLDDKLEDIINNSQFYKVVQQIEQYTKEYLLAHYKSKGANEKYYKDQYLHKYKFTKILIHTDKIIKLKKYWNYERLCAMF